MKRMSVRSLALSTAFVMLGCAKILVADSGNPQVSSITPAQVVAGGQAFSLTVYGSNFVGNAVVLWNGSSRATQFISKTQLQASIASADIQQAGSVQVTVGDQRGNSVPSNPVFLTIQGSVAITVSPSNSTVTVGSTQQFVGNVSGTSNTAVTWTVSGASCTGAACGTISTNGLYVAPAIVPSPSMVTVLATSVTDPTKSASASVTIVAAAVVLMSISPANASVPTAATQLFSASVTGTSNTSVNWNVSGAGCSGSACGSLSTSGLTAVYSAPAVSPSPTSVNVTAVSAADSSKSAAATVTVVPVVAVIVSPSAVSVTTGGTQQFNATVTGNSNTSVSWSVTGAGCSGAACGTISSAGLYTAPTAIPSPATLAITATSSADPSKSGVANLTIVAPAGIGPTLPTLPQATVDLTMPIQGTSPCPTLTTGSNCIRNVPAGDAVNFQKAINAATCGDTIVLVAGSTYSGNFTIPATTCTNNSGWIFIVSSALSSLPTPNHRVGPSNVSNMATVSTPNTAPTFAFQGNSTHWRLIGLEITTSYISTTFAVYNLVIAGLNPDTSLMTSTLTMPSYLIFDRIWIHGFSNANVTRAYYFDVSYVAVVDGSCTEIHHNGSDAQCINSTQGPGPFLIQNNDLEAAGENIMFGGTNGIISNVLPSDITIVGNYMTKPLVWRNQASPLNWVVKNLFELKNAQRLLLDGNVLNTTWAAGQDEAVIIRAIGNTTWTTVQDITVTNNLIEHAPIGIIIWGPPIVNLGGTQRVLVQNNLLLDISAANWGGSGWAFELSSGSYTPYMHDVVVDHNTSFSDTLWMWIDGAGVSGTTANTQFTNNLGDYPGYGLEGDGTTGPSTLTTYAPSNIWGATAFINSTGTPASGSWPSGTNWSAFSGVGFTSVTGTDPNYTGNFQLTSGSAYHNAGTDGNDIGVWDWTVFNAKTTNALNGTYQ